MTNNKTTKRALFSSVVALLLCFTMLLGTTFAWFTDSATSGRNTIQSGNLDVVLEYKTDWNDAWVEVDENTKLFKEGALYEPGYTEVVFLRVSNAGSLALKYNLKVDVYGETTSTNVDGDTFSLKDYLEIGYYVQDEYSSGANYADLLMPVMFGNRETALSNVTTTKISADTGIIRADSPVAAGTDTAQVVAIVLTMPTSVGNEANHKTGIAAPTIDLGVSLLATQYTDEKDSFDNQYDKDATYDGSVATKVDDVAALKTALANGENVQLNADIALSETLMTTKDVVIDLNGKTLTAPATGSMFHSQSNAHPDITITSSTAGAKINVTGGDTAVLLGYGSTVIENVTINVTGCDKNSPNPFNVYGNLTLGEGTVVNVDYLGTSLISNNGAVAIKINGAEINIGTFKTNATPVIYLNQASTLEINNTEMTISDFVPSNFGNIFISKADGVTIQNFTFNVKDVTNDVEYTYEGTDKYRFVEK